MARESVALAYPHADFRLNRSPTILLDRVHRKRLRSGSMAIEEKPSRNEDEYFARLDADLMKERRAQLDAERLKQERSAHHNKCPKCGADLKERDHNGVKIDQCEECGGIWLDKGELELLEEVDRKSSGFVQSIFGRGR